jgi:hypothetical protein
MSTLVAIHVISKLQQSLEWTKPVDGRSFAALCKNLAPCVALLWGMIKKDECTANYVAGAGQRYKDGLGAMEWQTAQKDVGCG